MMGELRHATQQLPLRKLLSENFLQEQCEWIRFSPK